MAVKEKMMGDIAVVRIKGKLMGGSETDECHVKVKEILAGGTRKVILDLSSVKWLNSRGLGMLMACFTSTKSAGGEFKLTGASGKVNSLFMMTKLLTVFDTYSNVDQAVGSFKTKK